MTTRATRGSWLLAILLPIGLCALPAHAQQSRERAAPATCSECHSNVDASKSRVLSHADSLSCLTCHHVGLSNDAKKIQARRVEVCRGCHNTLQPTHAQVNGHALECSQCHDVHGDKPLRQASLPSSRCTSCHEKPHALHATSGAKGPQCSDCHDLHAQATPLRQTDARVSRRCLACHESAHPSHAANAAACTSCHKLDKNAAPAAALPVAQLNQNCTSCHKYTPKVHAAVEQGAPACTDCHSYSKDAPLPEGALAISQRCGSCHEPEIASYRNGGHAKGLDDKAPNRDLPNCVSCHTVHDTAHAVVKDVRRAATERCITCHSSAALAKKYQLAPNVGASYLDDFHGATLSFQNSKAAGHTPENVLTCSDCHGAHDVAIRDKAQIAQVCQNCHDKGSVKLAGAWLGHRPASPRNLIVVWLVRLFYYTLIPFVLIGLMLHIIFQVIDQRRKGARLAETDGMKQIRARIKGQKLPPQRMVQRFSRLERAEHLGSMLTFIVLCVTGLPQTRPDLGIAHTLIEFFGGIGMTRIIHRTAGFLFVALLVRHVAHAILRALRTHHMPVMATNVKLFRDAFETVRHFLCGPPRPKTGKFDFSEKFEYWGLFMGGTLMSVTGVALVFPEIVTQFLPGLFVAVFRVMHGLEATFAVMVVVLWHSYGVILRPEVFPLDTSIFTGKISMHRLKEEHYGEFEELFPEEAALDEQQEEHAELVNAG